MRTPTTNIIDHFKKVDPELSKVVEKINYDDWFEDKDVSTDTIFRSLCRTIVGQQLAGAAAKAIYSRFENLLQGQVTPDKVLSIAPEQIREVGLSWAKVRSVIDLSTKVKAGELILENLLILDNEKLIEELDSVRGIGRWTAEMFLMFQMGREDIFSWGDLGLKKGLSKMSGADASEITLKSRVESWAPYRTYAAIAMWHILDNE